MKISPINKLCENKSREIFESLKGKRFIAISIDNFENTVEYFVNSLTNEEIVYGCEFIKNEIFNGEGA